MNKIEDDIRRLIISSAKTRFDYASFAEYFKEIDEELPEILLFQIIVDFSNKEENEIIALKIMGQILTLGFVWKENQILEFLSDKREVFKIEIGICTMVVDMLTANMKPIVVLNFVLQMLK